MILLIALLIIGAHFTDAVPAPQDSIPPEYLWISPKKYSIHTTNNVRICVDAVDNDGGSGIKKVVFYANYLDNDDRQVRRQIGEVFEFPYEITWNCTDIQDQSHENLALNCTIYDNAGNVALAPSGAIVQEHPFVLDRNPHLKSAALLSGHIDKELVVDGYLGEWAPQDSIVFTNNDNTIIVFSLWSSTHVYFGIRVEDSGIVNKFEFNTETGPQEIYNEDDIEIYLDVDHDHYQIRNYPDRTYLIAPSGAMYTRMMSFNGKDLESWKEFDINAKIHIQGTINDDRDKDSYYSIELAIPWDVLGITAKETKSMGLNIWNCDKDYVNGDYYYSSWTTQIGNQENPSEWENIVFVPAPKPNYTLTLSLGLAIGVVMATGYVVYARRGKKSAVIEKEYIVRAKQYIEEHYSQEHLSRDEVAQSANLTPSYFGHLFKEETGMNFTDYLISVKIKKAKTLLTSTNKTISEIAFEVGFSSSSYFGSLFKKKEKISPKEFRRKKY